MEHITKKTSEEIELMREGGRILSEALSAAVKETKPGVSTDHLDEVAVEYLRSKGAEPSFLNYQPAGERIPYPCGLCVSINREIVHGLAKPPRIIKEGDLVSLDFGAKYKGMYTDMAVTFYLGKPPKEVKKLINATRKALRMAVKKVKPGNRLIDIGRTIEDYITKNNFGIVRDLVGHGVGYAVHESPRVPNYSDPLTADIILEPGMCLAIEPMVTIGDHNIKTMPDGWTVITADNSLSAHAEVTVAVTKRGNKLITPYID